MAYGTFNSFPIGAKLNMPKGLTADRQFKNIYDCGMNTVCGGTESAPSYMDAALNYNIKYLVENENAEKAVLNYAQNNGEKPFESVIRDIKKYSAHSAYAGEIITSRPDASMFEGIGAFAEVYRKNFNGKLCGVYIGIMQDDIENYVNELTEKAAPSFLICKICPYYGINNSYFYNIDIIRKKAADMNIPFFVCVQTAFSPKNEMSVKPYLRWQAFTAIAMGAKGIFYGDIYPSDNGGDILTENGEKTALYDYIDNINKDISKAGNILYSCVCEGITADGAKLYSKPAEEFYPVISLNGKDYLAGCFTDGKGGKKMLVTNLLPNSDAGVALTLNNSVSIVNVCIGTSSFSLSPKENKLDININAGDAVLIEFVNQV